MHPTCRHIRTWILSISLLFVFPLYANQVKIARRLLTNQELEDLKRSEGTYSAEQNYNILINGHGTGLRPPTEEEWQVIRTSPVRVEQMNFTEAAIPPQYDNSQTIWFPPIGNQGKEGSCVAWAVGYYAHTFLEAKEHNWNLSGCTWSGGAYGQPTAAYQDNIFSPDFIYHQINDGEDNGSSYVDAMNLLQRIGCSTWDKMPNNPENSTVWPSEAAWRQAPLYRSLTGPNLMLSKTDAELITLKQWLANGNLAIISVNADKFADLSASDLWTINNYNPSTRNHVNVIVGYDDSFGPYSEDGQANRYGAFKVANSWGTGGWEHVADGFYYLSYECMKQRILGFYFFTNWIGYEPGMISVFKIDHASRGECVLKVGLGPEDSPKATKRFDDFYYNGGDYPFPTNSMVLDISEFQPLLSDEPDSLFLGAYDGGGATTGSIKSFSVERYTDYQSGSPTEIYSSSDPPLNTAQASWTFAKAGISGFLHVEPAEIDLGNHAAGFAFSADLLIRNDGTARLIGTVSENAAWISTLQPSNFDLSAGQSGTIACSGNFPASPGNFSTIATINSDGGNQNVNIKGTVQSSEMSAPALSYPRPDAQGLGDKVVLSWHTAAGAESYDIQLDDDSNFSSPIINEMKLAGTRLLVSGLNYSQIYYWHVRSRKASLVSAWSETRLFTAMSQPAVSVGTPDDYILAYLQTDDEYYTDRDYVINNIPGILENLLWIKSANDDQSNTSSALLSFTLNRSATVYIAYDHRAISVPNWLSAQFILTEYSIEVSDKVSYLPVWSKQFEPGTYTLGGNLATPAAGAKCNYSVLLDFAPQLIDPMANKSEVDTSLWLHWEDAYNTSFYRVQVDDDSTFASPVVSQENVVDTHLFVNGLDYGSNYYWRVQAYGMSGPALWSEKRRFSTMRERPAVTVHRSGYVLNYMNLGDEYYNDRSYIVTAVPSQLDSLLWIKTANEDRSSTSPTFLTLELERASTVYVAYDHRASSVPTWLSSQYTRTNHLIETTDNASPMVIWSKQFEPGTITLGGNQASGASGAKSNFVILLKISPPPLPDLQIAGIALPHSVFNAEEAVNFSVIVQKLGGQLNANKDLSLSLFASIDNQIASTDIKIGEAAIGPLDFAELNEQGSRTLNVGANFPGTPGDYHIGAIIDPANNHQESDESNNSFATPKIQVGRMTLLHPDSSGIAWQKGSMQSILWESQNLSGKVSIDLIKGNTNAAVIVDSTANSGNYSFLLPVILEEGNDYQIRISDAATGRIFDQSRSPFSIVAPLLPDLQITNFAIEDPVENVAASENITVTLRRSGGMLADSAEASVWIYASQDGNISSDDLKIGVSQAGDFTSDALNSLGEKTVVIPCTLPAVAGDYFLGAVVDPGDKIHESNENNNPHGGSTIKIGRLTLTYPDSAGISWEKGTLQPITWSSDNVHGKVRVRFYKDHYLLSSIVDSTDNDGYYAYLVSNNLLEDNDYTIFITDLKSGKISDESSFSFSIKPAALLPDLRVSDIQCFHSIQNAGGEDSVSVQVRRTGGLLAGDSDVKIWLYASVDVNITTKDFKISESNAGDFSIAALNGSGADSVTLSVTLPPFAGDYYLGAIADPSNTIKESDETDNRHTGSIIHIGKIKITRPDTGATIWQKGTSQTITWTSENVAGEARIWLVKGANLYAEINSATTNDGNYEFVVPQIWPEENDFKLRIQDAATGRISDESDKFFSITPQPLLPDLAIAELSCNHSVQNVSAAESLSVTIGRSNASFPEESEDIVVWLFASSDTVITIEDEKIGETEQGQFSTAQLNTNGSQTSVIAAVLPENPGDYYLGAIVDPANTFLESDETNNSRPGLLMHLGRLTILYPDSAGIVWLKGSKPTVLWSSENVIGGIQIKLFHADTSYYKIVTATLNDGDHTFQVPEALTNGSDYKVWIADVQTKLVSDLSNESFIIKADDDEPLADFTAQPPSGTAPLEVQFQDHSIGDISAWQWDFGDDYHSEVQHPLHTFENPGQYSVNLIVTGPAGSDTLAKQNYIIVTETLVHPVADFNAEPLTGKAPLQVRFFDISTGTIASWLWRFGDGQESSEKSPVHVYDKSGSYSPTLIVTGSAGQDSVSKFSYITVSDTSTSDIIVNRLAFLDEATEFSLSEGYPNPFNSSVKVNFSLPQCETIEMEVVDLMGRKIRDLFKGTQMPGRYQANWDGLNDSGEIMPSGIYFIHFQAAAFRRVVRIVLIR